MQIPKLAAALSTCALSLASPTGLESRAPPDGITCHVTICKDTNHRDCKTKEIAHVMDRPNVTCYRFGDEWKDAVSSVYVEEPECVCWLLKGLCMDLGWSQNELEGPITKPGLDTLRHNDQADAIMCQLDN